MLQGGASPAVGYQVADAGHLAPGAIYTTPQTVQGSDLMRYAAVGDATLLIGGDLTVTVFEVFTCLVVGVGKGQRENGRGRGNRGERGRGGRARAAGEAG